MPGPRAPTGATAFALELDGAAAGLPRSAAGGDAVAEVVVEPAGPDGIQRKHLGAVRYTDIVLTCGTDMEKPFWSWLADTMAGKSSPRDGALRMLDFDRKERELATFTNAVVTEIGFPALDAASKDAFLLTVRIAAESVERKRGSGASEAGTVKGGKQALVSNFRVSLDGLNLDSVARVGPLTLRRRLAEEAEIPDLELTLSEAGSESIVDWHRTFVIDGSNSERTRSPVRSRCWTPPSGTPCCRWTSAASASSPSSAQRRPAARTRSPGSRRGCTARRCVSCADRARYQQVFCVVHGSMTRRCLVQSTPSRMFIGYVPL